jgi:hypothetical protein
MACDVQINGTKVEPVWLTLLVIHSPPVIMTWWSSHLPVRRTTENNNEMRP